MKEIQYEIVKEIAVLSQSDSGYTKEINLISWNGNDPKYDIRSFSPDREKCGKGITLTEQEVKNLLAALQTELKNKLIFTDWGRIFAPFSFLKGGIFLWQEQLHARK